MGSQSFGQSFGELCVAVRQRVNMKDRWFRMIDGLAFLGAVFVPLKSRPPVEFSTWHGAQHTRSATYQIPCRCYHRLTSTTISCRQKQQYVQGFAKINVIFVTTGQSDGIRPFRSRGYTSNPWPREILSFDVSEYAAATHAWMASTLHPCL